MNQKTNICMIGGPGVGKSPVLKHVLAATARVDPYRARTDGARAGEDRYVSPDMWEAFLRLNRKMDREGPKVHLTSQNEQMPPCTINGQVHEQWIEVYTNASFFTARKDKQVLLHDDTDLTATTRKVELFAPVFFAILRSESARKAIPFLRDAKTIFLLLNPLAISIREIDSSSITDGAGWITDDWIDLQFQRSLLLNELSGLDPDAVEKKRSKMAERVAQLPYEAAAWKELAKLSDSEPEVCAFVECLGWNHFEYKYLGRSQAEIQRRVKAAKTDILKAASASRLGYNLQSCLR